MGKQFFLSGSLIFSSLLISVSLNATEPDWSIDAVSIPGGRENIYELSEDEFSNRVHNGKLHALKYPVSVSGIFLPAQAIKNVVESDSRNPLRRLLNGLFETFSTIKSMDDLYSRIGLQHYPASTEEGVYQVPYPENKRPDYRMGVTFIEDNSNTTKLTFSCAACHAGNLFGKTVLGLTNKTAKANEIFVVGKKLMSKVSPSLFKLGTGASKEDVSLYVRSQENMSFVEARSPAALGLDTSLAHTALSMSHRSLGPYAEKDKQQAKNPREEILRTVTSDSKPSVWWTAKYKTRWLSDGSLVSGNPIFTNFLWNEIGRGTDLHELEHWLESNPDVVKDLTAMVFASKPPKYTDFFPPTSIDLNLAKQGEQIFNNTCAKCHGSYEKGWSTLSPSEDLSKLLETVKVNYHQKTPVIDVGTDKNRYEGMKSLEKALNPLAIQRENDILIIPQKGYVPPPLEGIFARWPYFHNNSAPTLCAVLTASNKRPKKWYVGESFTTLEFDQECNGFPVTTHVPKAWRKKENLFDTTVSGLSNTGHDEGIFLKNGEEILTSEDKKALIEYLKVL